MHDRPEAAYSPQIRASNHKHEVFNHIRKKQPALPSRIQDFGRLFPNWGPPELNESVSSCINSFICQEYFTFISTSKEIYTFDPHFEMTHSQGSALTQSVVWGEYKTPRQLLPSEKHVPRMCLPTLYPERRHYQASAVRFLVETTPVQSLRLP